MATPPFNVLWVCTDSQRWDTLGCYGNPLVHSPNLDRLAREGVLFENAFCQNPLSTPSRASFLTGRYPVTLRLRQNGQGLPTDLVPVTRTLRDRAGYLCGLSGKLHLSPCDQRLGFGPEWWREDPKRWPVKFETRIDDGYSVFHWDHAPGHGSALSSYVQWLHQKGAPLSPKYPDHPLSKQVQLGQPDHLNQTTFCTEKAVEFIDLHHQMATPNPWLFSVNPLDPHPSYRAPEAYLKPYLDRLDRIPLPSWVDGEMENKPAWQRPAAAKSGAFNVRDWTDTDKRMVKAAYWAMCDLIDTNMGRLLDALERTGQRENTLIIFTSDHGELLGDHGKAFKGAYMYEGSVHVPLIVSLPGVVSQGLRSPGLVELTDLAPTLLQAAHLPQDPAMQGRSLWPLLTGQAPADHFRDDVYCEYYNAQRDQPPLWVTMLRTAGHKLVAVHGSQEGELYDLEKDLGENRNLWADPAAKDLKIELLLRMAARMAWTADPMPQRTGIY